MNEPIRVRIALTKDEWLEIGWAVGRHVQPDVRRGAMDKLVNFIEIIVESEGYNAKAYDCPECGTVSTFTPHYKDCPLKEKN